MRERLYDAFESYDIEYHDIIELKEADGSIGDLGEVPKGVLGVFKVKHAFGAGKPFGISRNGRLYTKDAWDNALKKDPEFKEAFENNMVVGMLSHPEKDLTYDDMLREELASHLLKDIKYKEVTKDSGIYEATFYILDTKAGRTLKAILAAGAKPAVSTRAYGSFKEEYVEYKGKRLPIIDEKDFKLVTLDVVSIPGLKNARFSEIKLTEQLKEDLEYLEEKAKEYKCEDGICELVSIIKEESKNENKQFETKSEKSLKERLKELDKDKLIELLQIASDENKNLVNQLTQTKKDNEEKDKEINKKVFITFVEMLSKLLKFNKNYEEDFEKLIEILDKDNIFEEKDIKIVKDIIEKLKKDELIDESIKKVISNIENFINNKNESLNLDSLFESSILFFYNFLQKATDNEELKKELDKYMKETDNYKQLTQNYKDLAKKLGISLSDSLLKEKEENFRILQEKNEIQEKYKEIVEKSKKLEEKLNNYIENKKIDENQEKSEKIKNFEEKIEKLEKTIENLQNELKNKEIQEKTLKDEINELKSQKNEKSKKLEEKLKIFEKRDKKLENELKEFKIKFLVTKYTLTEEKAKNLLEKYEFNEAEKKAKEIMKERKNNFKPFEINEEIEVNEIEERILRLIK